MRILYFGNNWLGYRVLRWLKEEGEDIVALVIHPTDRQKFAREIISVSGLDSSHIFSGDQLQSPITIDAMRSLCPEIGISVMFGYIIPADLLSIFPKGCINLHPSLLPYNRGAFPNVWAIVDETPAGVTLHFIDEGIDTGDIIAQREVPVEPVDTGETLYRKLEESAFTLFVETWPLIKAGNIHRKKQRKDEGTFHRLRDVQRIDRIELDRFYKAKDLINILRARTFPPYPGVYFDVDGRRVYLRLQLYYDDELKKECPNR
ncbi:MAG: formyl transferase [Firmicutes bacterium]|nr:formyl transferase [Bacillota bacterium]